MSNFSINFSHPWLLFLLIPAVVILVVAMMRVPRKYRNTRNRVVSVTLEAIVLFCAIMILAGLTFTYTTGNAQNEIILLVDVTETMDSCAQQRDEYIEEILYRGEDEGCQMGIVTFGFTQVYAAPLSTDAEKVYDEYINCSEIPDTSATDIAAALEYSRKLFSSPETSKIVVISDGKETDESALSAITAVTSQGTVVETVYIPSGYEGDDIQIVGVEMPEYHVSSGDTIEIKLDIRSSYTGPVSISVSDNGESINLLDTEGNVDDGQYELVQGSNPITLRYTIYDKYLHAINITINGVDEEILTQNNNYCVYVYIDSYNKILIFQRKEGESEELVEALQSKTGDDVAEGEEPYDIRIMTLDDESDDEYPITVDELRQYDLVILNNTSNADMYDAYLRYLTGLGIEGDYYTYFFKTNGTAKSGGGLLPQLLYTYVSTYGGGLLTVGGVGDEYDENGNLVANMYSRSDMYGTVLQQMLPVTAINYTPPTGVVVIIDTSGSMGYGDGSLLNLAILGVLQSLDLLSVRDYMGVIEFSSDAHVILSMTSLQYSSRISAALNDLIENPQSEGTALRASFSEAVSMLEGSSDQYEREHIIIVTDGLLSDTDLCYSIAQDCYSKGITVSAVVVGGGTEGMANMRAICQYADDGVLGSSNSSVVTNSSYLYDCSSGENERKVGQYIYEDIQATVWAEVNYEETQVQVSSSYIFSSLLDGLFLTTVDEYGNITTDRSHLDATLSRFYGTTIKSGASLILTGDYSVPIYAQWSYGAGMVGSFMGDLHDFEDYESSGSTILSAESGAGVQFIINVVDNLMPTEDIRPNGITVTLSEDNYTDRLNVYADVQEGYTVDAKVYLCNEGDDVLVLDLNSVTSEDEIEGDTMYYVTVALTADNNYSRANFVIKAPGTYKIVVSLLDEDGNVVINDMATDSTATIYKEFSYSAEYNNFNSEDGLALMNSLSTGDKGDAIQDADDLEYVYSGLVTRITKTVDPRLPLIIIALVLFLLGIAVRKFKWKWPHEIVRERKMKKNENG